MKLPTSLKAYIGVLAVVVCLRAAQVLIDGGYDTFGGMLFGFWLPTAVTAPTSLLLEWLWPRYLWNNYWMSVLAGGSVNVAMIMAWHSRRGRPT